MLQMWLAWGLEDLVEGVEDRRGDLVAVTETPGRGRDSARTIDHGGIPTGPIYKASPPDEELMPDITNRYRRLASNLVQSLRGTDVDRVRIELARLIGPIRVEARADRNPLL
jgi:hypothetical protein